MTVLKGRPNVVYRYQSGLYVNFTNRCPTACAFCVKFDWKMDYRGYDLKLGAEPSVAEVLEAVDQEYEERHFHELVFCGYGESTYRLPEMMEVARACAGRPFKVRLNTVGLGNLIWGRRIAAELRGLDSVRVSLNSSDPAQWRELMRPKPEFLEKGHQSVLEFISDCVRELPETVVTAVELPGVDLQAVRQVAQVLGARFLSRPLLQAEA